MFEIIFYSIGTLLLAYLVWLLLPSPTFKYAQLWLKQNELKSPQKWLRYQTIKRSITPHKIAMNIVDDPEFSEQDLNQLNSLFEKLSQPPAEQIKPNLGDRYIQEKMMARNIATHVSEYYVSEQIHFGVEWRNDILKRAEVNACSADRLMLHKLHDPANVSSHIVSELANYLQANAGPDFALDAANLQGFIQQSMLPPDQVLELFQALIDQHPEHCFAMYWPQAGDAFNFDRMSTVGGALAGKNSTVQEVLEPGFERKGNSQWRIKARVKI